MNWLILFYVIASVSTGYAEDTIRSTLDFIYIDSSVDESAGGHAAVRFGQTVFHYQFHHNGLCLLVKENWSEFQYSYNNLQNRNLFVVSLPLSVETYQKVKTQFLTSYLLQNRRLSNLEQLNSEIDFFTKILSDKLTISIRGLGFFNTEQKNNSTTIVLREIINDKLGTSYIADNQHEIAVKLDELIEGLQTVSESNSSNNSISSVYSDGIVNRYMELREFQEALSVIAEARSVADDMLIRNSSKVGQLNQTELNRLQQYREAVKDSIFNILLSSRSDKGSVLLIQIARFYALTESLKHRYLITLDPFSKNAQELTVHSLSSSYVAAPNSDKNNSEEHDKVSYKRTYLEQIRIEQLQDVQNARKQFFLTFENENIAYNQLESALGRFFEINSVGNNAEIVRIENKVLLPCKIGKMKEELNYAKDILSNNIVLLQADKIITQKQLNELYGYNLIAKNCVTELFNTINSSFSTSQQAKAEMGGYLEPNGTISYIPFCAFYLMKQKFPHAAVKVYPSYRKRQKDRLYEEEGIWALVKESNTLTSDIYYSWDEDTTFLFFTDDVVYTRPMYGIGNTMFAVANMAGGLVWAPIDEGSLLKRSMRGLVFSLPELAFFNIRKGTFPATAFDE